jgi:hypothetical protein
VLLSIERQQHSRLSVINTPLWGDGQEKGKKRHLTEGMTEKTLTDLTPLGHVLCD